MSARSGQRAQPKVILPSGPVPVPISVDKATGIGSLAHLVITLLAPDPATEPERVADLCLALAHELAAPSPRSRANSVLAAGFAGEYLRTLRPLRPWAVLGVEYPVDTGRVDIAYQHATNGQVFFDEVKTTHVPLNQLNRDWVDQAHRYAQAGSERFGSAFLGTRLLPLGSRHLASLVTAKRVVTRLLPRPDAPIRGSR